MKTQRKRTVLAVDDEEMNLMILAKNAKDAGYDVVPFSSADEAWQYLSANPTGIDIALLDKMMPGMNGIELLKKMKETESLKHIPVIIQTGDVGIRQMCEGLESGAFYYLTKPFHSHVLHALLQAAENECLLHEELHAKMVDEQGRFFNMMQEGEFGFSTHSEAKLLAAALSQVTARSDAVARGLMELFSNAIEHGNMEIGYQTKQDWLMSGRWVQELAERMIDPTYSGRRVKVRVEKILSVLQVTIRDDGKGFDWCRYLESEAAKDALNRPNGRGMLVAMGILDDVRFSSTGNEVRCNISISNDMPTMNDSEMIIGLLRN